MNADLTTDREIRSALHAKQLSSYHNCPNTIVLNELGLAHASVRIDIAVLNGCLHGYEIKSDVDTLRRLPKQLAVYEQCLEELTIVCAPRHTEAIKAILPSWCGILEAQRDSRGAIIFKSRRTSRRNKNVQANRLAHLLWRDEAAGLLANKDLPPKIMRQPRKELYLEIAKHFSVSEITASIKAAMVCRPSRQGPQGPALCDD